MSTRFTTCPRCGYPGVDSRTSKGGKAGTGKAKARTSEQAKRASRIRWGQCPSCYASKGGMLNDDGRCNTCGKHKSE